MAERPEYARVHDRIEEMQDRYRALSNEGRTDTVTTDHRARSKTFTLGFLNILKDEGDALAPQIAGLPGTLDTRLAAADARATALEKRYLAGLPLKTEVTYRATGGAQRVSDTLAGASARHTEPDDVDPARTLDRIASWERKAQAFTPRADPDGTYRKSASELARIFGVRLDYDFSHASAACPGTTEHTAPDELTAMSYCAATPQVIYVNTHVRGYDLWVHDVDFVNVLRHELSHKVIDLRCGTAEPPAAGTTFEGVTNSYSLLYLGNTQKGLRDPDPETPEYVVTDQTDAVARKIHSGSCS